MQAKNRKVLLLIDNCAAHSISGNYSNIEIHFLLPNATSVLQPMDQGVIKSFKAHYRRRLLNRLLAAIDRGGHANFKINMLKPCKTIRS